MIKTGIAGADSEIAGDLTRILINHPEVEIRSLFAPGRSGQMASSIHFGLLGEEPLVFTDSLNLSVIDLLFVCGQTEEVAQAVSHAGDKCPKIIDVCGFSRNPVFSGEGYIFGLSEIYRKSLVRGAKRAVLPSPVSSVTLVALYPLAKNLLLNSSLELSVEIPAGLDNAEELKATAADEISSQLAAVQLSFDSSLKPSSIHERSGSGRGIRSSATLRSYLSLEDLENLYLEIYDDHNFTILSRSKTDIKEVLGTDRIVVSLSKETPDTVHIEAIADEDMRGGAAEAVHIMNLLFGLHEKTGMTFLPTAR